VDLNKNKNVCMFEGHTDGITCIYITADSCFLASGSTDKTVIVCDFESGAQECTFVGHTSTIIAVHMTEN
jgi:WD40 repeat protein